MPRIDTYFDLPKSVIDEALDDIADAHLDLYGIPAMIQGQSESVDVIFYIDTQAQVLGFETQAYGEDMKIEVRRNDITETPKKGCEIKIGNRIFKATGRIDKDDGRWIKFGVK